MISLRIVEKGAFMSKLLATDSFDSFLLEEAVIKMAATLTLDGHLNREFYSKEVLEDSNHQLYDFSPWSEMRKFCYEWIRGKTAPIGFRFTLRLKPEYQEKTLPEEVNASVGALVMNIRMDTNGIHVVTGVAMKLFTLDKTAEEIWDKTVMKFLDAKGLKFEEE